MTRYFRCDHSFEPENQVRIGGYRVGCKTCRNALAWKRIEKVRAEAGIQPRAHPDARLRDFS